ncbi:MAG: hypothetical protein B9S32_16835 [Verrucomicrobia bacterium Tous-C9LFEB]|nr:MAG: hypothetical protein B9S32_16835 [Verrucomicrobia bacterium Tous-C9LFEB]
MSPLPTIGLYPIRGVIQCCHLLVDANRQAVLIDTGLIGEFYLLRRLLRRLDLKPEAIQAILLTHGHLDHTSNLAAIREWTGAPLYAHPDEQRHIDGTYPYQGAARWCGRMESIGRTILRYRSVPIDHAIQDGVSLPFWGGLQVIHLPGHTAGHCGFYSASHDLLFSGDLFASYFFSVHPPPPILNSESERLLQSFARVAKLNPRWILPNHYDWPNPELHRRRFTALQKRENKSSR